VCDGNFPNIERISSRRKVFADRSDSAFIEISLLEQLDSEYEKILGMLNSMEMKADKFCFLKPK